jgi:cell division septum initiation protein DivIVA
VITAISSGDKLDRLQKEISSSLDRVKGLDTRLRHERVAQTYSLQEKLSHQVAEMGQKLNRKHSASSDLSAGYGSDVSELTELVRTMSQGMNGHATKSSVTDLTREIREMKEQLRSLAQEGLSLFLEERLLRELFQRHES